MRAMPMLVFNPQRAAKRVKVGFDWASSPPLASVCRRSEARVCERSWICMIVVLLLFLLCFQLLHHGVTFYSSSLCSSHLLLN